MKTITLKIVGSSLEMPLVLQLIRAKIIKMLLSQDFTEYLGKRMSDAIMGIAIEQTGSIEENTMSSSEISDYLKGFDIDIIGNSIYLYNSATIDTSTKNISEDKRGNYPLQLSLAKLIEYGFGYVGFAATQPLPENWQYDINAHGNRGWYYIDKNGLFHWTNGLEGRLVFRRLSWWLANNFSDIMFRYLKNNLKGL